MTLTPEQVAPHLDRFLDMLDAAFRRYGSPDGLPDRFRDAVRATPRHLFVHRFRIGGGTLQARVADGALRDSDADPTSELADIYSDAVMTHVDAAGNKLPSTNSQPSYVLWLLHMLDLQPGQLVLEIGSGSGWLAAVMARLVGKTGRVTGLEIIPELAAQSRADLVGHGLGNVSVLATDGADGHAAGAPFDRVMITAACWDLPGVLFDQVAPGGRVLVPVELRGGGCQVTVLRREGDGFLAERAVPGWFVPLIGQGQDRPQLRFPLAALPFWAEIGEAPSHRVALPLATGPDSVGGGVAAFRAFLGRVGTWIHGLRRGRTAGAATLASGRTVRRGGQGGPLRGVLEQWRTARLRRPGCDADIGSGLCDVGIVRVARVGRVESRCRANRCRPVG